MRPRTGVVQGTAHWKANTQTDARAADHRHTNNAADRLLGPREIEVIVRGARRARRQAGGPPLTPAELRALVDYVERLVLEAATLRLLLKGEAGLDPTGPDPEDWTLCLLASERVA